MKNSIRFAWIILLLITLNASADLLKKEEPVRVKFYPSEAARPGEVAQARLEVEIRKGWHIFSDAPEIKGIIATQVLVDDNEAFTVEQIKYPGAQPEYSDVFKKSIHFYTDLVVIPVVLKLKPEASGELAVNGTFRYQACSDKLCLPPSTLTFTGVQPIR